MTIRSIIFGVVIAALHNCDVTSGDNLVELTAISGHGLHFPMPFPTEVIRCTVTSNAGVKFSLVPDERPVEITQSISDAISQTCGMTISSVTTEQIGVWTIQATAKSVYGNENVTIKRFQLQFVESFPTVNVSSSQELDIPPDHNNLTAVSAKYDAAILQVGQGYAGSSTEVSRSGIMEIQETRKPIRPIIVGSDSWPWWAWVLIVIGIMGIILAIQQAVGSSS